MTNPVVANSGLSHIALRVRDVQRSIVWYQTVLGFELLTNDRAPTPDRTRCAMGLIGGGALALEFLQTPEGRAHDIQTLGVAGVSITVPDIEAAVAAYNNSPYGGTAGVYEAGDWRASPRALSACCISRPAPLAAARWRGSR